MGVAEGSFHCACRGVITEVDTEGNESIIFPINFCAGGFEPDKGVRGPRVRFNRRGFVVVVAVPGRLLPEVVGRAGREGPLKGVLRARVVGDR